MSETDSCRAVLSKFCLGNGIDIGAGGSPILPSAISIDREEGQRANVGECPIHLVGDAERLNWFADGALDFVYSSHCLEDFRDTKIVLKEWMRVLKYGGLLVLFLPDQATYEKHCAEYNTVPNQAHVHKNFSLEYVKQCLMDIGVKPNDIVHAQFPVAYNPYSFEIVVRKAIL